MQVRVLLRSSNFPPLSLRYSRNALVSVSSGKAWITNGGQGQCFCKAWPAPFQHVPNCRPQYHLLPEYYGQLEGIPRPETRRTRAHITRPTPKPNFPREQTIAFSTDLSAGLRTRPITLFLRPIPGRSCYPLHCGTTIINPESAGNALWRAHLKGLIALGLTCPGQPLRTLPNPHRNRIRPILVLRT